MYCANKSIYKYSDHLLQARWNSCLSLQQVVGHVQVINNLITDIDKFIDYSNESTTWWTTHIKAENH